MVNINLRTPYFQTVIRQTFPICQYPSTVSQVLYCLLSNQWRLFDTLLSTWLSSNERQVPRFLPFSAGVCSSRSWSHCLFLLLLAPITIIEAFEDVLRWLGHIVYWCVELTAFDVSNITLFMPMTHNASNDVFSRQVSTFSAVVCSFTVSTLSIGFLPGSFGVYTIYCSAIFSDGDRAAR